MSSIVERYEDTIRTERKQTYQDQKDAIGKLWNMNLINGGERDEMYGILDRAWAEGVPR